MPQRAPSPKTSKKANASVPVHRAAVVRFQQDDAHGIREATALAAAGFDVNLLMLRSDNEIVNQIDPRVNVVLAPISKRRGSALRYAFEFVAWFSFCSFWLAKETRRQKFSYVQVDSLPDHQVFCALVPKIFGAKVGLFLKEPTRELCLTKTGSRLLAAIAGWVSLRSIAFADVAFCVTEPHRQSYIKRGVDASDLQVVLNSTPPFAGMSRSRTADDGKFVVVCHGTIEQRYGHKTIVEAASIAVKELPGLSVHLPGKGTYTDTVAEMIGQHGLEDVVSLDGWVTEDELSQLLANADVGVVAQLANPYSHQVHTLKMYDYMSAGVAIVASRLRATETLFPDEITYFESGDAAALANAWVDLHDDPDRRLRQIVACRERLAEVGSDVQMKHMVEAISATIAA